MTADTNLKIKEAEDALDKIVNDELFNLVDGQDFSEVNSTPSSHVVITLCGTCTS